MAIVVIKRRSISYRIRETLITLKLKLGGHVALNTSFQEDLENGLASRRFDIISQNGDDSRPGLDEASKEQIRLIMSMEGVSFDKARWLYTERQFGEHGIAPDGTPLDPKAITFSS